MMYKIFRRLKKYLMAWILICASGSFLNIQANAATPQLQGYVMQVQMTPAICALDVSKQKQRQCLEGYSLTITGLLPEINRNECTTNTSATLSPIQAKVVARVMPDESARIQLWRSIGGCIPMNSSQYFRMVINLAEKLKIPTDLTSSENKSVKHSALKAQFLKLNPSMSGNSLRFSCQNSKSNPVLTEIQVCYTVNGQYKQCSSHIVSNCPSSFLIKGTY
ncbi:ribonuclease T2 family protein [Acinetobacter sp. ANC 4648]|uniref:ribonuclease T2 family protein n=1 Tax=Acinetobacter sp. ANC 4648 TaxID=1977875 RepID=UPI000A32C5B2|nr:ribonuclease I [Acinetobacter sp. ANC 4648]OTG84787.1 ribonuclease I [Acinetobacter sp. ANC 4648]